MVVKGADGHVEAAFGALVGEAGRDRLGGAEVRAEQHGEPCAVPGHERGRCDCRRSGGGGPRRGGRVADGGGRGLLDPAPGSRPDLDAEVGGLHGEGGLGPELVVEVVHEVEALQQHAEHEGGLLQRELPADAGAEAGPERLVGGR